MRSIEESHWRQEAVSLSTAMLHESWPVLADGERLCRIAEPTDRALVLGSSTAAEGFDLEFARHQGLTIVRRRSGGGAVLVEPGAQIWLMLYLRLDDSLITRDIGTSFLWLGATVQAVLEDHGIRGQLVTSRQHRSELGALVCFADLGFGEITVDGAKVLGLAQRRSRGQACFQLSLLWHEHQSRILQLLTLRGLDFSPLHVAGIAPLVEDSRQTLQGQLVRAITTLQ
ncbi:hypothetical protein [Ferrimicrobium sp.]|uniref:lipoyl protein ligase domain-containing protein n=1 Tax=Ferrimicrobium sp. TaxID=2926050 RepID=UPI00262BEBD6|nr:hypothetical protein [Ferrimicrobium sp.]